MNCFADDSGLEVEALGGEPGVYSARYSGSRDMAKNIEHLLEKLHGQTNRKACFKTVISLILDGREYLFEGKIEGRIIHEKIGDKGFGYDPIFVPDGYSKTFAEMDPEEKNAISHRAIAVANLADFLFTLWTKTPIGEQTNSSKLENTLFYSIGEWRYNIFVMTPYFRRNIRMQ